MSTPAIECTDLTRSFESGKALDSVSFAVPSGEVLALLGPNGAGKTTTVRLLNGVLAPDAGSARVAGWDPATQGDEVRRRTGVLTENAGLDERLTSRENLEFAARTRGMSRAAATARTSEMLERFGMADRADDLTQGFSTGQRKRVALARALLHDPEVLFLDEPTSGLDPAGTRDVIELIQSLAGEGRSIVLATHFLGEAGRLADRMAVLYAGRLQAFGRPAELAASLWKGNSADIHTGGPAADPTVRLIDAVPGVLKASSMEDGLTLRVADADTVPRVVAALVAEGIPIYGVQSHPPTLEDVYFAIEQRIADESGEITSDGFLPAGPDPLGRRDEVPPKTPTTPTSPTTPTIPTTPTSPSGPGGGA